MIVDGNRRFQSDDFFGFRRDMRRRASRESKDFSTSRALHHNKELPFRKNDNSVLIKKAT